MSTALPRDTDISTSLISLATHFTSLVKPGMAPICYAYLVLKTAFTEGSDVQSVGPLVGVGAIPLLHSLTAGPSHPKGVVERTHRSPRAPLAPALFGSLVLRAVAPRRCQHIRPEPRCTPSEDQTSGTVASNDSATVSAASRAHP
jgi:hypothetical protein